MMYYKNLEVRSFKEVREDTETRRERCHRLNFDATEQEWYELRRHAELAGCSLVELVGAAVRLWMDSAKQANA